MTDGSFLFPLQLTLRVASLATLFALVSGVLLAWVIHRFRFPGRNMLDAVLTLPMVLPPTVLGYYLIVLIGRNGVIGGWLESTFGITLMFTWQGAVIAASVVAFPLVFKSARAALEGVGQKYENAARTLGCGEWQIFLRVLLPMAVRGIVAGTMLAFARAMGEFGATLMVAGNLPGRTQTMPLAVYSAVQTGNQDLTNMLVLVLSASCVLILWITGSLLKPKWEER
ncbi:molybdate transport system permease protein [Desulfonatronum zhilinae]|nr:molybdate transport system permease protein [Desulfonatronum zhilinae]